ncbi:MAG: MFS transporter [Granulosicoccaceae bacterium]
MRELLKDKPAASWAIYDWANSAFACTVVAGFYPLFFKQYWSGEEAVTTSTFYLGLGNSLAALVVMLLAPLLGAMADRGSLRKRMLRSFMVLGVISTAGLALVGQGQWPFAVLLFVIASVGFEGANVFYDSLLVLVSKKSKRHYWSAVGYSLGYLGCGLLFAVNVMMTLKPAWFGLADAAAGVRASFVCVGVWWLLFSIPLLRNVKEPEPEEAVQRVSFKQAFAELKETARNLRQYRAAWAFLLAFWFYIDGVHTVIAMAVDYGLSIGLPSDALIVSLLIVQFIGFPAALMFGRIGERFGPLVGIWIALGVYSVVTVFATTMHEAWQFYLMAAAIGLVQGGVQALSRSLFSQLIPQDKSAEFFGFYNVMGKSAAIIGPLLVGVTAAMTQSARLGMLSILILFVVGGLLLLRVQAPTREQLMED